MTAEEERRRPWHRKKLKTNNNNSNKNRSNTHPRPFFVGRARCTCTTFARDFIFTYRRDFIGKAPKRAEKGIKTNK